MKVNGIEGVCPDFNCDYVYISTTSLVTSQSLSGTRVTIGGVDLPTGDIQVKLSNSECEIVSASATQIECDLTIQPAAGSWSVRVTDDKGLIPVDSSVTLIDIGLTVDVVAPNDGLNQLGGDILSLSGSRFDTSSDSTTVTFSDGTPCDILETGDGLLVCEVSGFDATTLDPSVPQTVNVQVNGVEYNL